MQQDQAINDTIRKFGFPDTEIASLEHWVVLLRPSQATLGALVIAAKGPATAFPELPEEAFAELRAVTQQVERMLQEAFAYDRMNYLMLMMVDPHVHFHALPRFAETRAFADLTFTDPGWPGPPEIQSAPDLAEETLALIRDHLRAVWQGAGE